jgi:hypothetical protein
MQRKMNFNLNLTPCAKCLKYLDVKCQIIKFLGDSKGENFQDQGLSEGFLDMIPKGDP